jgi:hypothetical protein
MRRIAAVLVAVVVGVGLATPPASADQARHLNERVSGPVDGTTEFEFGTNGCSFVFQVWQGTYETARGRVGSFRLAGCVEATGDFPFTGTFILTAPNGAVLTGTVSGTVFGGPGDGQLFTLGLVDGTKDFRNAAGTIQFTGNWSGGTVFTGALVGALRGR